MSLLPKMGDPVTPEAIENWFGFHPATAVSGPVHDAIRFGYRKLAHEVSEALPAGPDRTLAIRKLQEAMWAANACIACNTEVPK